MSPKKTIPANARQLELEEIVQLAQRLNRSRGKKYRDRKTIEVSLIQLNQLSAAVSLYQERYGAIAAIAPQVSAKAESP